jgi:hypothetical protein
MQAGLMGHAESVQVDQGLTLTQLDRLIILLQEALHLQVQD